MVWAVAWKVSSMGSMWGEWKAWLTWRGVVRRWWLLNQVVMVVMAVVSPEMTRLVGELMAAMVALGWSRRWGASSVSVAWMAVMAPVRGRLCMRAARVVMRRAASGRVRMPAAWAAVISPTEWPRR